MKKIIYTLVVTTVVLNAWAIQTHRAIDRTAYEKAKNLETFMDDTELDKGENYAINNGQYIKLNDWSDYTYFTYITDADEEMKHSEQKFTKYDYKDIIEAGAILEDALFHLPFGSSINGYGRYLHHFMDPQEGNSGWKGSTKSIGVG